MSVRLAKETPPSTRTHLYKAKIHLPQIKLTAFFKLIVS